VNNLHTLTALTGRDANANRTFAKAGFEARRRTVVVLAIGLFPALIATAIVWAFIGQYAAVVLPVVEGAVFWLVESRTKGGLQQKQYTALLDKRRSDSGRFYMCGQVVDPDLNELGTVVKASVANPWTSTAPPADQEPAAPAVVPEFTPVLAVAQVVVDREPEPETEPATSGGGWNLPRAAAPISPPAVSSSQSAADIMFGGLK
jgi:hypothetical protein